MAGSPDASHAGTPPAEYPPAEHVMRDLGLWSEARADPPRAGLRVDASLRGPHGACAAGVLALLVDVVAGGAGLREVEGKGLPSTEELRGGPAQRAEGERSSSWIATSDLSVHWLRPVAEGELIATATPLRSGRTSVVVEVEVECGGARVAHGTAGFARLEAKGAYQTRRRAPGAARIEWSVPERKHATRPWAERLGVVVRDARAGMLELPITPYVVNSLGGLQGGVAVALLDLAAEAAGRAELGRDVVATRDLAVHFLAIARQGPVRTNAEPLRGDRDALLLRLEARDAGASDRHTTLATAALAPW